MAPLYKALADSGLGAAVIGGGLDDGRLPATFSVGLNGVRAADSARVEPLVLSVLTRTADEGFSCDHVAGHSTVSIMR